MNWGDPAAIPGERFPEQKTTENCREGNKEVARGGYNYNIRGIEGRFDDNSDDNCVPGVWGYSEGHEMRRYGEMKGEGRV